MNLHVNLQLTLRILEKLCPFQHFFFFKERSVTSVVHSMSHIPQTLRDFGPMQNYSTFNFESVVGMFEKPRMYSIN